MHFIPHSHILLEFHILSKLDLMIKLTGNLNY